MGSATAWPAGRGGGSRALEIRGGLELGNTMHLGYVRLTRESAANGFAREV